MTSPNHALTGALIGLSIGNPLVSVPLAFLSHFVLDAVPHYDPPGDESARISSQRFSRELFIGALLCILIVLLLFLTKPQNWFLSAACAFLATSPDLFWLPKYLHAQKTQRTLPDTNWFWRFHSWIQWRYGPQFWAVELIYFLVAGYLFLARL